MSAEPLLRLLPAFGDVLVRHRRERKWTVEALAIAAGLSTPEIASLEDGSYGPNLLEFFRIARAFHQETTLFLVDVIEAWRADPTENPHTTRPSGFTRLFCLGYRHKRGDFREVPTLYYSVAEATHAAGILNAQRHARGVALVDTVCIYVRVDYVSLKESPR
jgi:DNA-binding XRE family transcriptional regulator